MEKISDKKISNNIGIIIKGFIISFVVSLILLLFYSAILTYTSIPESTINPVIITITGISILIGSCLSTIKISKNGMLNGGLVGLIYILTIYILSSIIGKGFILNSSSVIMIIVSIITGIIGGIIGVNKR